jgi:hypothetical protein
MAPGAYLLSLLAHGTSDGRVADTEYEQAAGLMLGAQDCGLRREISHPIFDFDLML